MAKPSEDKIMGAPAPAAPATTAPGEAKKSADSGVRGAAAGSPPELFSAEEAPTSGMGTPRTVPGQSGLKAGFSDDNAQFSLFLRFLAQYKDVPHEVLAIDERIVVKVVDKAERPVAGAAVELYAGNQGGPRISLGQTYSDGSFTIYPRDYPDQEALTAYRLSVTSQAGNASVAIDRSGPRNVLVKLESARINPSPLPVDILFVLDTTGSMGEEIERLRATIEIINTNIAALKPAPSIRFGMVLYRDRGDDYVTKKVPFTANLAAFQRVLDGVEAGGGDDTPEDLVSALDDAVRGMAWREGGLKLGFVITDAPAHLDYGASYGYASALRDAKAKGIKLFTIGTGGLPLEGEYLLRQVAQYTQAKYIFLTYGEGGESAGGNPGSVSHHTGSNFTADKLEAIVIRFVKEELARYSDNPLPLDDSFYQADRIADETREATLAKLFAQALQDLADYSTYSLPPTTRLAVMPLAVASTDAAAGPDLARQAEYFGEQLGLAATRSKLYTIVERQDLQSILKELELQLSGIVDEGQAARVGKLMGAEVLVTGTIYSKDGRYEIFLKLVRVETAEVLAATKAKVDARLGL
jgi:hypothetical protein